MPRLSIFKSILEAARDRATLSDDDLEKVRKLINAVPSGMSRIDLETYPIAFLRAVLETPKLNPNQRAVLALHIHGLRDDDVSHDQVYQIEISNPVEFGSTFAMFGRKHPSAELKWNRRWYPVILQALFQEDEHRVVRTVYVEAILQLGERAHNLRWLVEPSFFLDDDGNPADVTVLKVIEQFGLRRVQLVPSEYNLRLVRAERLAASAGAQVWVKGSVLELRSRFWFDRGLSERALGTADVARRAIVEPQLDLEDAGEFGFSGYRNRSDVASRLPLVRIFSLDTKGYFYADIDDLEAYEYDDTALSRLILPGKMKDVLTKLFETPVEALFGDLVRGKHGGIVILACGSPGVGKTLTAEIYAEIAQRPLYVLEFGELGTSVKEIEEHLEAIFARVVRWHAVLQFDECEIFLSQRGDDLERSAIVGIFLRMLDYYEGLLFLTTNLAQNLDAAIRSRVMLRLDYPPLDQKARSAIWRTMFTAAEMHLVEDDFDSLGQTDLNGRQIRNLVRLARILYPRRTISLPQMQEMLEFGCR